MLNKQNRLDTIAYSTLAAIMFTATFAAGYFTRAINEGRDGPFPLLAEAQHIVRTQYLGELPSDTKLEYSAIRGMVAAMGDPYTVFLEPPSQELESQSLQGEFGGIGVNLRKSESGEVILSPFPDLPAARAGIEEGDILIAVDGTPITPQMSLDEIAALVRGPVGTKVVVTVRRGSDAPRDFTLTRESIEIPSVAGRVLDQDPTIGLVAIGRFSEKTPDEVQRTIDDLQAKGVTRIVLDLRGNGGGLLTSAVDTAGLFLDGGVIMYEVRRGLPEKTYAAPSAGKQSALKLVILINHGTASAAEILAGALRDRGRGPLIGQTTYGKGSVQLIFALSDNSSLHVTNARWYTANHTGIDGVGLKPDIEVQPGAEGSDTELDRAVQYLQSFP